MAEVIVNIPDDLKIGFESIGKEKANQIFCSALREHLSERLMFELADKLLEDSEITDDMALERGRELKERVAKRHGIDKGNKLLKELIAGPFDSWELTNSVKEHNKVF